MNTTKRLQTLTSMVMAFLLVWNTAALAMGTDPIDTDPGQVPAPHPNAGWDWTEDVVYTLHVVGIQDISVRLPYFQNMGPAGELALGADTDIYPADGWVAVSRDFGTPTEEVTLPSFLLYNKYRGILRYFFFNTIPHENYTFGRVSLRQSSSGNEAALFTFGEPGYFVNDFDTGLVQDAIVKLVPMQWCYADFVIVGYDPYLPTDARLSFDLIGVEETELQASGGLALDQVLNKTNITGKLDPLGALNTAHKKYKDTTKTLDDLRDKVNEKNGFWKDYLGPVLNSDLASAVPYVSTAVALVKAFIGGKPKQVSPMKFKGGLELSGNLTTVNPLHTLVMFAPGALLSDPNSRQRPIYTEPLGIFNVVDQPTMQEEHNIDCTMNKTTWEVECTDEINYSVYTHLDVVINPALSDATVDVKAGFAYDNQAVTYYTESGFNALTFHEIIPELGNSQYSFEQMALKVSVTPTNNSYPDPIVMTNLYDMGPPFWTSVD